MDSPRAVITDANIWIDLHRGEVTAEAFKLNLVFKTPDLVAHEILSPSVTSLKRLGLQIVELSGIQVFEVIQMARKYPRPSRPDLSALVLAAAEGTIILTGDKALRAAAEAEGLNVRGVLWLLEMMVDGQILTGAKAIAALQQMLKGGSRLPQPECERCIQVWRTARR